MLFHSDFVAAFHRWVFIFHVFGWVNEDAAFKQAPLLLFLCHSGLKTHALFIEMQLIWPRKCERRLTWSELYSRASPKQSPTRLSCFRRISPLLSVLWTEHQHPSRPLMPSSAASQLEATTKKTQQHAAPSFYPRYKVSGTMSDTPPPPEQMRKLSCMASAVVPSHIELILHHYNTRYRYRHDCLH